MIGIKHIVKFLYVVMTFSSILIFVSCDEKVQSASSNEMGKNQGSLEDVAINIGITVDGELKVTDAKGGPVTPLKESFPMDISKFHSQTELGSLSYEVLEGNPVVKIVVQTEFGVYCTLVYLDNEGNIDKMTPCPQ